MTKKYKTRLNCIYNGMKTRCYNSNEGIYKNYGGRGITVCEEWLNNERIGKSTKWWIAFKKWALSNGYSDNLTIDRIDVNKGYSPDNCRWVSMKEQNNNRRSNHFITYKGKTQTLAQWCEELNLEYSVVAARLCKLNWSIEQTFETKENANLKMITHKGKTQSLADWCRELNLNYNTVQTRINRNHWSIEKVFETKRNPRTKLVTYNGNTLSILQWCKKLGIDYKKTWKRITYYGWSVEKAFETK